MVPAEGDTYLAGQSSIKQRGWRLPLNSSQWTKTERWKRTGSTSLIGGIAFGLAQTLGGHFFGVAAQMLVAYTMLLMVLAVISLGIFGR